MDVPSTAVAHVALDADGAWRTPHDLAEHLRSVGALASEFAAHYGAGWARLAGRWHDLGKYRPRFQRYIRQASGFEADAHIKEKHRIPRRGAADRGSFWRRVVWKLHHPQARPNMTTLTGHWSPP